jgi:hypothetical protein
MRPDRVVLPYRHEFGRELTLWLRKARDSPETERHVKRFTLDDDIDQQYFLVPFRNRRPRTYTNNAQLVRYHIGKISPGQAHVPGYCRHIRNSKCNFGGIVDPQTIGGRGMEMQGGTDCDRVTQQAKSPRRQASAAAWQAGHDFRHCRITR